MKISFAILSSFVIQIAFVFASPVKAKPSVEIGSVLNVEIPVPTPFTCNIRVTRGSDKADVEVDQKTMVGIYKFEGRSIGVEDLKWKGENLFFPKNIPACFGSGKLTVETINKSGQVQTTSGDDKTQQSKESASPNAENETSVIDKKVAEKSTGSSSKSHSNDSEMRPIDYTSFVFPRYKSGMLYFWNNPEELISYCYRMTKDNKQLLKGTEFSFRMNSKENVNSACLNWLSFTESILNGAKLSEKRYNQNIFGSTWDAKADGVPIKYSLLSSKSAVLGWYFARGKGVFSEGTFGSPLGKMPDEGVGVFRGQVGYGTSSFKVSVEFAKVDYGRKEIFIKANFAGGGGGKALYNLSAIKFNPNTGYFNGKVGSNSVVAGGRVLYYKGIIAGFLGGKNGDIIHATYHTGSSAGGVDFVLGQRVSKESLAKAKPKPDVQQEQKASDSSAAKIPNSYGTVEKCLGKNDELAKVLSEIIGFKYSALKDCGSMYIWTLNDGGVILLQGNGIFGWKRSLVAGEYLCFDNFTKRKYRGKWDTCKMTQ